MLYAQHTSCASILASPIFCHSPLVSLNVLVCLYSLLRTKGKCYLNEVLPTLPFISPWMQCFSTVYREVFTDMTYSAELVICISQHTVASLKAQAPLSFHKCCWKSDCLSCCRWLGTRNTTWTGQIKAPALRELVFYMGWDEERKKLERREKKTNR